MEAVATSICWNCCLKQTQEFTIYVLKYLPLKAETQKNHSKNTRHNNSLKQSPFKIAYYQIREIGHK